MGITPSKESIIFFAQNQQIKLIVFSHDGIKRKCDFRAFTGRFGRNVISPQRRDHSFDSSGCRSRDQKTVADSDTLRSQTDFRNL